MQPNSYVYIIHINACGKATVTAFRVMNPAGVTVNFECGLGCGTPTRIDPTR